MNCDPIAHWYWLLETSVFGHQLERTRQNFLPAVRDATRVLALGDGDGRALVDLLTACPHAHVDYVDSSAEMLKFATERIGKRFGKTASQTLVRFRRGDILEATLPEAHYDLITSHFFLDCFSDADADRLIAQVSRSAAPRARWIISEFSDKTKWAKAFVRTLYFFFWITTGLTVKALIDYRPMLEKHGFRLVREQSRLKGLLVSELWQR